MQPPATILTSPGGRYGAVRAGGRQHWGLDIAGKAGAPVAAPESLTIEHVATDNVTPPLSGYGPGAVLGRGASGQWHVLGHLDPATWSGPVVGRVYAEGEWVGNMAPIKGPHVHWEVRTVALPARGAARGLATLDPVAWLRGALAPIPAVAKVGGASALLLVALAVYLLAKERR